MTKGTQLREFLAGLLAAAVMTVAMAILRLTSGVLSLPEMIGEGVIRLLPPQVFSRILDALLGAAKPSLELGILLGQLLTGGLLGRIYARKPGWRSALVIAMGVWLVVGVALLPLLGLGLFGSALRAGGVAIGATLLAVFLVFGAALVWLHATLLPSERAAIGGARGVVRRSALAKLGLGVAALAVGGYGWRALTNSTQGAPPSGSAGQVTPPGAAGTPAGSAASSTQAAGATFKPSPGEPASGDFAVEGLSPEVTPTRDFYTVSKNFFDPTVDLNRWSLTVDGLVERPLTLDYEAIQRLPSVSDFYTLQCISNPVGGDLWGNAHWTGIRLADLMAQAGLKPGIRKVVFHAADDYTDSIVLERALNTGAILAYEMNGAPLEKQHGYPARLLIPNIYGMKNVKWITRIELVDYDFKGYWMQRGWDDAAPYKTSSRIDVPTRRSASAAGEVTIGGVSFAGERGITAVEYSLDDGGSWQPAQLKPALATNTWQLWAARPTLPSGRHTLKVRATDGSSELQTAKEAEPLPDGASGYHTVVVTVA
jgi:DMSO/TMAO reductase YedYZ molybdopterin-dependent catalytic subunit